MKTKAYSPSLKSLSITYRRSSVLGSPQHAEHKSLKNRNLNPLNQKMRSTILVLLSTIATTTVFAQDPADGWMAYAVGSIPDSYERITRLEMYVYVVVFFFSHRCNNHTQTHTGRGSSMRNLNTDSSRSSLLGSVWILRTI